MDISTSDVSFQTDSSKYCFVFISLSLMSSNLDYFISGFIADKWIIAAIIMLLQRRCVINAITDDRGALTSCPSDNWPKRQNLHLWYLSYFKLKLILRTFAAIEHLLNDFFWKKMPYLFFKGISGFVAQIKSLGASTTLFLEGLKMLLVTKYELQLANQKQLHYNGPGFDSTDILQLL